MLRADGVEEPVILDMAPQASGIESFDHVVLEGTVQGERTADETEPDEDSAPQADGGYGGAENGKPQPERARSVPESRVTVGTIVKRSLHTFVKKAKTGHRRAAAQTMKRSIVLVRVVFNGHEPSYCDDQCLVKNMWAGKKSVAGMFAEASYGAVSFPQELGEVVTVHINNTDTVSNTTCKFWQFSQLADTAAAEQHGLAPRGAISVCSLFSKVLFFCRGRGGSRRFLALSLCSSSTLYLPGFAFCSLNLILSWRLLQESTRKISRTRPTFFLALASATVRSVASATSGAILENARAGIAKGLRPTSRTNWATTVSRASCRLHRMRNAAHARHGTARTHVWQRIQFLAALRLPQQRRGISVWRVC